MGVGLFVSRSFFVCSGGSDWPTVAEPPSYPPHHPKIRSPPPGHRAPSVQKARDPSTGGRDGEKTARIFLARAATRTPERGGVWLPLPGMVCARGNDNREDPP